MLPGFLRPQVRFDPARRRRVRRSWVRVAPVAVPLGVLCLLLVPLLRAGPGTGPAGAVPPDAGAAGGPGGAGSTTDAGAGGWSAGAAGAGGLAPGLGADGGGADGGGAGGGTWPAGSVVVAVAPLEPGLVRLLRPGDHVDVYGHAPVRESGSVSGADPPPWLLDGTAPVTRLAEAAVVVAVPARDAPVTGPGSDGGSADGPGGGWGAGGAGGGAAEGTVALALSDAEARAVAGARQGGLDLALRGPPGDGTAPP